MEKSVDQNQIAWGPNILLGLIMAQTVCKGFQQRKPADKELFINAMYTYFWYMSANDLWHIWSTTL